MIFKKWLGLWKWGNIERFDKNDGAAEISKDKIIAAKISKAKIIITGISKALAYKKL